MIFLYLAKRKLISSECCIFLCIGVFLFFFFKQKILLSNILVRQLTFQWLIFFLPKVHIAMWSWTVQVKFFKWVRTYVRAANACHKRWPKWTVDSPVLWCSGFDCCLSLCLKPNGSSVICKFESHSAIDGVWPIGRTVKKVVICSFIS